MKPSLGQKIGEYVKYQREKRQLTITQLAEDAKLTAAYISRLEQGDYDSPSLEACQQLSEALRMPLWAFLTKSGATDIPIDLPDLAFYLHEKYQYPPEAIADIELFVKFIEKKYQADIKRYHIEHNKYWKDR